MIGYLKGILAEKKPDHILLLVNNVGYEVEVPASSLCLLPKLNEVTSLYILTYVREDCLRLFGFVSYFDKLIFDSLIQVSGIGPKAALALLGVVDGVELCHMIIHNQVARITATPGIGLKTAERLVLELKTKLQKLLARHNGEQFDAASEQNHKFIGNQIVDDLKSALLNLGYKEKQFAQIVDETAQKIQKGDDVPFEVAFKNILKKLSEHALKN